MTARDLRSKSRKPKAALTDLMQRSMQAPTDGTLTKMRWDRITPRRQVRDNADLANIDRLAESIRQTGQLQPIQVMPLSNEDRDVLNPEADYVILAGERRWHACKQLDIAISAVVRDQHLSGADGLYAMIEENTQREDLSPFELARGIVTLRDEHGQLQDHIAKRIGVSKSFVSKVVRLHGCPLEIERLFTDKLVVDVNTLSELAGLYRRSPEMAEELIEVARTSKLTREMVRGALSKLNAADKENDQGPNSEKGAASPTPPQPQPPGTKTEQGQTAAHTLVDHDQLAPSHDPEPAGTPTTAGEPSPVRKPEARPSEPVASISIAVSWLADADDPDSREYGTLVIATAAQGNVRVMTAAGEMELPANEVRLEGVDG